MFLPTRDSITWHETSKHCCKEQLSSVLIILQKNMLNCVKTVDDDECCPHLPPPRWQDTYNSWGKLSPSLQLLDISICRFNTSMSCTVVCILECWAWNATLWKVPMGQIRPSHIPPPLESDLDEIHSLAAWLKTVTQKHDILWSDAAGSQLRKWFHFVTDDINSTLIRCIQFKYAFFSHVTSMHSTSSKNAKWLHFLSIQSPWKPNIL